MTNAHAVAMSAGPRVLAPTLQGGLTREYLLHRGVCPRAFGVKGDIIVAATADARRSSESDLAFAYQRTVTFETVARDELARLVQRLTTHTERTIELARADAEDDDLTTDVRDLANQPPVVRYVNLLVRDAYDASASDIHLEAARTGLSARFRVRGVLVPAPERIELPAELDIAGRRRPQDGRIRVRMESRELVLRVSTVPTMHGESVVLRLLDHGGCPVTLNELGMASNVLRAMARLSERPHGMLLVTGRTGSGKTTTLYAALQRRNAASEKIITVEDPIEYQLSGITQMPVHRQAGVTFATALRDILRQDPDVVMIGEMLDRETAEVAVQAAMTGHLVFSTLHTNDAVSAIPRLLDLGIPDYLVAATLEGVLAQRLVRKLCESCRGPDCDACRAAGFRGRVGIFELIAASDALRDGIASGATRAELRGLAVADGMIPLALDGQRAVTAGLTTAEEVARVVQE